MLQIIKGPLCSIQPPECPFISPLIPSVHKSMMDVMSLERTCKYLQYNHSLLPFLVLIYNNEVSSIFLISDP